MGIKIFVGNLSYEATEEDLRELFSAYGQVASVRVIMDRETARPRGFAFVEMAREADCANAVAAMDGYRHLNRNLRVSVAEEREGPGGGGSRRPRPAPARGGEAREDRLEGGAPDGRPQTLSPGSGSGEEPWRPEDGRNRKEAGKKAWSPPRKDKGARRKLRSAQEEDEGGGHRRRWDRLMEEDE